MTASSFRRRIAFPLTDRTYWDDVHAGSPVPPPRRRSRLTGRLIRRVKLLLGDRALDYFRSYEEYLLWDVVLPRYLSWRRGGKVIEVGSAPGERLVRMHRQFGLTPYGIDYSAVGVATNRSRFADLGLDWTNVILGDFISSDLSNLAGQFDVVTSAGFIEHFTDPRDVVDRHMRLLRPGGLLVVLVPNVRGVNWWLARLFCPEVLPLHNLDIMAQDRFASLFARPDLTALLCGYSGTFNFYLFDTSRRWLRIPLAVLKKLQPPLNVLFRVLFGERGAEHRWFSPSLVYIGVKHADD